MTKCENNQFTPHVFTATDQFAQPSPGLLGKPGAPAPFTTRDRVISTHASVTGWYTDRGYRAIWLRDLMKAGPGEGRIVVRLSGKDRSDRSVPEFLAKHNFGAASFTLADFFHLIKPRGAVGAYMSHQFWQSRIFQAMVDTAIPGVIPHEHTGGAGGAD